MRFLKLTLAVGALLLASTALTLSATAAPFNGGEDDAIAVTDCYPAGDALEEDEPIDEGSIDEEPIDEEPVAEEIDDGFAYLNDVPIDEDWARATTISSPATETTKRTAATATTSSTADPERTSSQAAPETIRSSASPGTTPWTAVSGTTAEWRRRGRRRKRRRRKRHDHRRRRQGQGQRRPRNDLINANDGKRDVVKCGAGRDRVRADKKDKLVGCEVRRR